MIPTPSRLSCVVACWLVGTLAAQTPAPPPVDPALPDQLKDLKAMVTEPKMVDDFRAIGLMQKLVVGFDDRNPKDKERLAKGFGDVFRAGKLRTAEKEILYRETADALAKMGPDGSKELARALNEPRFKDSVPLQAHLIVALGRTGDEKHVDWIVDTATRSPHDDLRAAAGEALGNFTALEMKTRREVVKQLVREWGSLHQRSTEVESRDAGAPINLDPQNARKTLRAVEGKWVATLGKLTGQSLSGFAEWQRWLNKNPNWVGPTVKKP